MLHRKWVRKETWLAAGAIALATLLIAVVYAARPGWAWPAFVAVALLVAIAALGARLYRLEWVMRHARNQLDRARVRLAEETARADGALESQRAARARLKLVSDALPLPLLYFDAAEHCRYHNAAARTWLGLPAERIEGSALRDIAGPRNYEEMTPFVERTLGGTRVEYDVSWHGAGAEARPARLAQGPWAPRGAEVVGFYLTATNWAPPPVPEAARPAPPGDAGASESDQDKALYLRSITEDMMADVEDPREKLRQALERDEFLLFVQEIQPIATHGAQECFEVLLRLKEEEDNLLPPGGFIPVAERYGMLSQIDLWVVRRLIRWARAGQDAAPGWVPPLFCVNLAEASIVDPAYAAEVRDELDRTAYPGVGLCFEIGEREALEHHAQVKHLIKTLKPAGCRFTIDSFGSTRVAFSYLAGLMIDFIKIDGNIVHNLVRDPGELAKARAIHRVCRSMGVKTIAESVELEETLLLLRDIGIDYVQGFGIAAPAPIAMLSPAATSPAA